jgi:type IV pilus assembly protein PilB
VHVAERKNLMPESIMSTAGEHPFGVERVDLSDVHFTPELLRCLIAADARAYTAIPIFRSPGCVGLAMADPFDLEAVDELRRALKCEVEVRCADRQQIELFVSKLYESGSNQPE